MAAGFARACLALINCVTPPTVLKTPWTSELPSAPSSTANPSVDGTTSGNPTHMWMVGINVYFYWLRRYFERNEPEHLTKIRVKKCNVLCL